MAPGLFRHFGEEFVEAGVGVGVGDGEIDHKKYCFIQVKLEFSGCDYILSHSR